MVKKIGLPSDTKTRGRERIGRVKTFCWFSSPDFTLRDKSWSVMEGCMAVVSTVMIEDSIIVKPRRMMTHLQTNKRETKSQKFKL